MCTEPLLHIGHSFVTYLPLEARKCVLGLDHCVRDPDIGVGPAPPPTARRSLPCRLAPLAWPLPSPPALRSRNVVGGIRRSYCGLETNPPRHCGILTLTSVSANWPRPSLHCQHRPGQLLWPGTEGELLRLGGARWVRDERVGVGAGPTQMSGSQTRRSRPKTHFLASRGRLKMKECPMCKRRPVHTCRRAGNWNVSPKSVDVAGGPAQAAMTQTAASPAGGGGGLRRTALEQ